MAHRPNLIRPLLSRPSQRHSIVPNCSTSRFNCRDVTDSRTKRCDRAMGARTRELATRCRAHGIVPRPMRRVPFVGRRVYQECQPDVAGVVPGSDVCRNQAHDGGGCGGVWSDNGCASASFLSFSRFLLTFRPSSEDLLVRPKEFFDASIEALHRGQFLAKHSIFSVQAIVILVVSCQDVGYV